MLHIPIIILSLLIILVIYLIFNTKEKFQVKFVDGVCKTDPVSTEYVSKDACENRYVCDENIGRCTKQPAPKLIKDSDDKVIDISYLDYSSCEKGCQFIPRQGVTNPRRCDIVPNTINSTDPDFLKEKDKGADSEFGDFKNLIIPTYMVDIVGGLKGKSLKPYRRKDDCENRYTCNEGMCEQRAGGEYRLERNCEKHCRFELADGPSIKLYIHFIQNLKELLPKQTNVEDEIILNKLKNEIDSRIPNMIHTDPTIIESTEYKKCQFKSDNQCRIFPKNYSVEITLNPNIPYTTIYEYFMTLVSRPLQFIATMNGSTTKMIKADYMYLEYGDKAPLCEKLITEEFDDFKNYTLLEVLDAKDEYELKKMLWNELDKTDIAKYDLATFDSNFRYNKSYINLPTQVHMSTFKINDPNNNLDGHYKNNVASISGFKFEIYNLDDNLLDNFKHKIYLDTDVINYAKKNYTDLKLLKIGLEDPNKLFDKLHEVLFLLYRTHDYRYYYKQLEVNLKLYTQFKYGLKNIHTSSSTESEIKVYEDNLKRVEPYIVSSQDDKTREKLLINLYSNNLGFKLKLNIFKDERLADIITYEEEPLIKSEEDKCNFIPRGETQFECKQLCFNGIPENKCIESECEKLCDDCETLDCKWNIFEYRENSGFLPKPAKIKAFSGNNSIKVTWIEPFSKFKINKYYIILSNNLNEVLEIYVYNSVNSINEYIIRNLENGQVYNINIICKNKYGISDSSNIESVIPREINTFDKETDINHSKYNDSIESYIKSQSLSGSVSSSDSEFTNYDQYKQKAELFERAIILNDLKLVLADKLRGGIEHNIYNVNIF